MSLHTLCSPASSLTPCAAPAPPTGPSPTHTLSPTHPCLSPQMSQSKQLVQSKEKEVTRLLGEEKALESSFLEKVEENKFKDFLVRVFKKKIKRVKKEVKTGGELARPY